MMKFLTATFPEKDYGQAPLWFPRIIPRFFSILAHSSLFSLNKNCPLVISPDVLKNI